MIAADVAFDELLQEVDRLLKPDSSGREHADVVADLLGRLARRMTELYEEREREVSSFHAWLEERLGRAIDELADKTAVLEYYEQPGVETLLLVIGRNHPRRTELNVKQPRGYGAHNRDRDLIVQGYERSMTVLRPIMLQIQLTDRLIDLIVYRLYGLTREERGLVDRETGYAPAVLK
ncbi:MAG: hypothetical protein ACRELX_12370 [Longimicrobiales bacterium]